jgi:hypothetical protein
MALDRKKREQTQGNLQLVEFKWLFEAIFHDLLHMVTRLVSPSQVFKRVHFIIFLRIHHFFFETIERND